MPGSMDRLLVSATHRTARAVPVVLAAILAGSVASPSRAEETLAERIDRAIEADQLVPLAPLVSDEEFLRLRVARSDRSTFPRRPKPASFAAIRPPTSAPRWSTACWPVPSTPGTWPGVRRGLHGAPAGEERADRRLAALSVRVVHRQQALRPVGPRNPSADGVDPAQRPRRDSISTAKARPICSHATSDASSWAWTCNVPSVTITR